MLDKLSKALKSYAGSERKAVVGVHGDLYSTAAAALCIKALGAERTECVFTAVRQDDEQPAVTEALAGLGALIRIVAVGELISELSYRCFYTDVHSCMEAIGERRSLVEWSVLRYMADCIGGFVVNPVTFDHRMLGEITAADRLADLAPFWKRHAGEVWSLAKEMGVRKYALDKIVDPDMVERLGCDLRDAEAVANKFNDCDYFDEHGNFVCIHTEKWPSRVTVKTARGWVPKTLSKEEAAVVRAHNKGLPLIRNLSLDMLDYDT